MALVTNRAIAEGIVDVAMVHDSFGCPAAQASRFRKIIREEFIRLYEDNDSLAHVREAAERALGTDRGLPELPIRGTLDLNGINKFAFDC